MPVLKMNIMGEPDIVSLGTPQMYESNRRYKYFDENKKPNDEFIEGVFETLSVCIDKKYPHLFGYLRLCKDRPIKPGSFQHIIGRALLIATNKFSTSDAFTVFFEIYFSTENFLFLKNKKYNTPFIGEKSKRYNFYYRYFLSVIYLKIKTETEYVKRLDDFEKIKKNYKLIIWDTDTKMKRYLYVHKRVFKEIKKMYTYLEEYTKISREDIFSDMCTIKVTHCRGIFLMYFRNKYSVLPARVLTSFVCRKRKHLKRWNTLYGLYTGIRSKTDEAQDFFRLYKNIFSEMENIY